MDSAAVNKIIEMATEIANLRKENELLRKQLGNPKSVKPEKPKKAKDPNAPKKINPKKPGLPAEELAKVRSENGKRLAAWRKEQKEAKAALSEPEIPEKSKMDSEIDSEDESEA